MAEKFETRRACGRGRASGSSSRAAGLPETISQASADVTNELVSNAHASHRETADDYSALLARLNEGFRVIACKDRLQWIIQRRDRWKAGAPRWTGFRYHPTREALIAACRALSGPCDPAAMASLALLPEAIRGIAG
ncbi:hypothetical protein P2H44_20570 [Albimonas sp. CAU 1670]|uniref:hypothetical protein n=1 Tax=Albimonas sp. CAU 1670 TaxID=3032599 RepID=UPI0023D993DF|nr:hypothetical protein [Albimonas sp. CAU 1670]MDF2234961.1 hypothetical protein [Albimonas sp. CAU 1670]